MNQPLISAIIVNWNAVEHLRNCIDSINQQTYPNIEIIMVDNASDDASIQLVRDYYPQVKIIANKDNLGYSGGANLGINFATGKYIAILNPDIILEDNYFINLVDSLEKDKGLGFVTGKLIRSGENKTDQSLQVIDSTGHLIFKNRRVIDRGQDQVDSGQFEDNCKVFSVCGAAPLYRRRMLDDIKIDGEYFDEEFFAYKEDIDLCWRANIYGWYGAFIPGAVALHNRGWKPGQRNKVPLFVRYHSLKNRYLMMIKNDFLLNNFKHLAYILFFDLAMFFYVLLFEPRALKAYLKVILLLPKMLKKRKCIMANKVISAAEMRRWFN